MTEALQAEKNERTANRLGHRSGYYDRKLVTRVGLLELRVPQDRSGQCLTELLERYQRSEKALVAAHTPDLSKIRPLKGAELQTS
jgi:putative transposase